MTATKKRSFTVQENAKWMHYRINDILYGYLKVNATYYENPNDPDKDHYLYITKQKEREIRKEVAKEMKCTERTIRNQIKILIEEGLLIEFTFVSTNGKEYPSYGIVQDAPPFTLISNEWLRHLIKSKSPNSLKIYIYLLNKHRMTQELKTGYYLFTQKELVEMLQYKATTKASINDSVKQILVDLKESGIIDFDEVYVPTKEKLPSPRKRLLFIAQNEKERQEYSQRIKIKESY